MAAARPVQGLQEEAKCPICLGYYTDPVTTKCGHNFCRSCISVCSEGAGTALHCPQCRELCPRGDLRTNRQLQNMVQLVKQLAAQRKRQREEEDLCEEHEERLKLFCEEDEKLICVVCRESSEHEQHKVRPAEEAAQKCESLSDGDRGQPTPPGCSKTPQVPQDRQSVIHEQPHRPSMNRHMGQIYPSPVVASIKQDLQSPHQAQTLIVANSSFPIHPSGLSALKPNPLLYALSVDSVPPLLTKYPIVWQGILHLKNSEAAVQLQFVFGNHVLAHRSLPLPESGPPLRITQRVLLEASRLECQLQRMTEVSNYCLLLALPCGRDHEDMVNQMESLAVFLSYLQAKHVAGIIQVPSTGSNQPAYILQLFPPCEFSQSHFSRIAPDLLANISNLSPYLMIVMESEQGFKTSDTAQGPAATTESI